MVHSINLSNRLRLVASHLPNGAIFADIGSDHAYLPCYVCSNDPTASAIAGEVNEGPLKSAKDTVNLYQLNHLIDVRLGDGLEVVKPKEVKQVVIAGMGGSLIKSILEQGAEKLHTVSKIIAQPNVDEKTVRIWFIKNGYTITSEEIIEENGHIYEVIVADKATNNKELMFSDKDLLFGPILLKKTPNVFFRKWKSEREKRKSVIQQLKQAKIQPIDKINYFEKELQMIEEVLALEENTNR